MKECESCGEQWTQLWDGAWVNHDESLRRRSPFTQGGHCDCCLVKAFDEPKTRATFIFSDINRTESFAKDVWQECKKDAVDTMQEALKGKSWADEMMKLFCQDNDFEYADWLARYDGGRKNGLEEDV